MPYLVVRHPGIVLDSTTSITLHASGRMAEILSELPATVYMASYVVDFELSRLDLRFLSASRIVTIVDLEEDVESIDALVFATDPRMDDGESVCAAIARHRDWAVATDDAAATSFMTERLPGVQIVTTPDIVRNWADSVDVTDGDVREVLNEIRRVDGFLPYVTHPLRDWWVGHL